MAAMQSFDAETDSPSTLLFEREAVSFFGKVRNPEEFRLCQDLAYKGK
jgi:hypothetical protein